jgi:hypothetical protein
VEHAAYDALVRMTGKSPVIEMVDWDDFDCEEPALEREPDEYEVSARNTLEEFFEANPSDVFFGNQLAVQNEDRFFHWITYRDEYGSPNICAAMGLHGEQMILAGFARKQFVMRDHNTRRFRDRKWTETEHNLDFIFERDGRAYWTHIELARRVARELTLPVDAPKALAEGTMNRFEAWHQRRL